MVWGVRTSASTSHRLCYPVERVISLNREWITLDRLNFCRWLRTYFCSGNHGKTIVHWPGRSRWGECDWWWSHHHTAGSQCSHTLMAGRKQHAHVLVTRQDRRWQVLCVDSTARKIHFTEKDVTFSEQSLLKSGVFIPEPALLILSMGGNRTNDEHEDVWCHAVCCNVAQCGVHCCVMQHTMVQCIVM